MPFQGTARQSGEVRDQFKGLAMKCKRLDAIEESVKDMDLNDVREKNIEGFQVS